MSHFEKGYNVYTLEESVSRP